MEGILENLRRGGGAMYQKNIRTRESSMEKSSCTPIKPKKYSGYTLKKIHSRNLIRTKFLLVENPPPPHFITFLMVRPYTLYK